MARGLNKLRGSSLTDFKFYAPQVRGYGWPEHSSDLIDSKLTCVKRHGKHVIASFESKSGQSVDMIVSPKMTGGLIELKDEVELKHTRAKLTFDNGVSVAYKDSRMFGKIHLAGTWLELTHLRSLGRDLMNEECDLSYFTSVLNKSIRNRRNPLSVKEFLLDQTYIAGIGNYMASEILHTANIKPTRLTTELTMLDCQRILGYAKQLTSIMIAEHGVSLRDYVTFNNRPGRGQHYLKVYDKQTCPLGHSVVYSKIAHRATYHCDTCQE